MTQPRRAQETDDLHLPSYNKGWDAAIESMKQVAGHVADARLTALAECVALLRFHGFDEPEAARKALSAVCAKP